MLQISAAAIASSAFDVHQSFAVAHWYMKSSANCMHMQEVEAFAKADPYCTKGLVTDWQALFDPVQEGHRELQSASADAFFSNILSQEKRAADTH